MKIKMRTFETWYQAMNDNWKKAVVVDFRDGSSTYLVGNTIRFKQHQATLRHKYKAKEIVKRK